MILARAAGLAAGTAAALRSPLWLRAAKLNRLLAGSRPSARPRRDPQFALRAAFLGLRLLARLRLPLWRNTCLYRSIAECLVLRRFGIPCRLRLGVTGPGLPDGALHAHAWVERLDAPVTMPPPQGLTVLQ